MIGTMRKCYLRSMEPDDLSQVFGIEHAEYPYPWSDDDFANALSQENVFGVVATDPNDTRVVCGYVIYQYRTRGINKQGKPRRILHVLNATVSWRYRDTQIPAQIIDWLVRQVTSGNADRVRIEVAEENLRRQLLLKQHGFVCKTTKQRATSQKQNGLAYVFWYEAKD